LISDRREKYFEPEVVIPENLTEESVNNHMVSVELERALCRDWIMINKEGYLHLTPQKLVISVILVEYQTLSECRDK